MRYFWLKPYKELELVSGKPIKNPYKCKICGEMIRLGEVDLKVKFVDPPPYPDALGVFYGPEWVVSKSLKQLISAKSPQTLFKSVFENEKKIQYDQIIIDDTVRIGKNSIKSGSPCKNCGIGARLSLQPLFIQKPVSIFPLIARVLESSSVYVIREDLAIEIRNSVLNVELVETFFDNEG